MEETAVKELLRAIASGGLVETIVLAVKVLLGLGVAMVIREATYWATQWRNRSKGRPEDTIAKAIEEANRLQRETLDYLNRQLEAQREFIRREVATKEQASRHADRILSGLERHDDDEKTRHEQVYNLALAAAKARG